MNRTQAKGSITVEAIVILGLIASLTPILYKHVSERRQDIENINEANTMLILKNAAKEYIEENKETISVGTLLLEPVDVGVEITGYQIGIRKDADGTINAMIAASDGSNDMKAAKVASLLGVSAGIYSEQDSSKAWGINGVWAEDIASYGFSGLPTGIPVVTTAFDEEETAVLDMEEIFSAIEEHQFNILQTNKLCLAGECLTSWDDLANGVQLIEECNENLTTSCQKAFGKAYNRTCQDVFNTYKAEHVTLPASGTLFRLTGNNPDGEAIKTKCYFTDTAGYNTYELITACNASTTGTCLLGYTHNLNRNCSQLRTSYGTKIEEDRSVSVKFGTADGVGKATTCWFPQGTTNSYEGEANTFSACQTSDDYACRALVRGAGYNMCNCQAWRNKGFMTNQEYKMFCDGKSIPYAKQYCINTAMVGVLADNVTVNNGVTADHVSVKQFTAPETGTYTISAQGGNGDYYPISGYKGSPGNGGRVMTTVEAQKGDIFKIHVANVYSEDSETPAKLCCHAVGISLNDTFIIVAGGGGGVYGRGAAGWVGGGGGVRTYSLGSHGGWAGYSFSGVTTNTGSASNGGEAASWRSPNGNLFVGGSGGNSGNCWANPGTNGSPYGGTAGSGTAWGYYWGGCWGGGGGGSGYCADGYVCSENANGADAATGRITYDIPLTP